MMKCLVCNKEYVGGECPRCAFPEVNIMGDYEEGLKSFAPIVKTHRERFMETMSLGVVVYRWKDDNGVIALDREDRIPFGTAATLYNKESWLEQKLARIPDEQEIEIICYIRYGQEEHRVPVRMPNLLQSELQQVGIRLTQDYKFNILLRNEAGAGTQSREMELFF